MAATVGWVQPRQEQPGCQFNIISSTVVAAYCGHHAGDDEVLDVLIAWRGQPGWFQRRGGRTGVGGTGRFGAGTQGHVSQYATYDDVTIAFDADFDAGTVSIGDVTVPLKGVNTILIDQVERSGARRMTTTTWIDPRLPLGVDANLALAVRSRELRQFLRCDVPMPAPSGRRMLPQPPIVTVVREARIQAAVTVRSTRDVDHRGVRSGMQGTSAVFKALLISALIAGSGQVGFGERRTASGIALDVSCQPLPGVRIAIDGREPVVTDWQGRFEVADNGAATVTLHAALAGFRRVERRSEPRSAAPREVAYLHVAGAARGGPARHQSRNAA